MCCRITALAEQFPKGLSDQEIQADIPELLPIDRATVVNRLLAKVMRIIATLR